LKADHQDISNKQEIAVCRNIKLHDGNAKKVLTVITLQIKFRPSQGGYQAALIALSVMLSSEGRNDCANVWK
jgi:hypothetical protein